MIDIRKLARKHGIPFVESGHPRGREGWVQFNCPQCGQGGTHGGWYLGFSLEFGNFHCWRCGPLKYRDVLPALLRISPGEMGRVLGEYRAERPAARVPIPRKRELSPPPGAGPMTATHRRYLEGRGFDADRLESEWGLLGTGGLSGDWNWRVVAPVADETGRVVAYQGRAVGAGVKPKYKMTADAEILVDPKGLLYGLDKVPGDTVLVVEGVTGVWRFGAGAVATLGIDWKPAQLRELLRFKRRFVLFDPEPLAQKRAAALAYELAVLSGEETTVLGGLSVDPGELTQRRADRIAAKIRLR